MTFINTTINITPFSGFIIDLFCTVTMAKSGANYASLYIQETRFASAFFLLKCKGANNYRITKLMDQQSSHRRIGLLFFFFFFLSAKEFQNNNKYLLTSTFIYITINITLFSGFYYKTFLYRAHGKSSANYASSYIQETRFVRCFLLL